MKVNQLPLLELFTKLKEAGLVLGIDEYQLTLRAIQAGFGMPDRNALSRLCCSLWVKSPEEKLIFDYHFEQLIPEEFSFLIDADISAEYREFEPPPIEPPPIKSPPIEPPPIGTEKEPTVSSDALRKGFSEIVERLDSQISRSVIRWVIGIAIFSGVSLLIGLAFMQQGKNPTTDSNPSHPHSLDEPEERPTDRNRLLPKEKPLDISEELRENQSQQSNLKQTPDSPPPEPKNTITGNEFVFLFGVILLIGFVLMRLLIELALMGIRETPTRPTRPTRPNPSHPRSLDEPDILERLGSPIVRYIQWLIGVFSRYVFSRYIRWIVGAVIVLFIGGSAVIPYAAIILVSSSGTLLFVLLLRVIHTRIKKEEFLIPVIENLPKEKSQPLTFEEDKDELQFALKQFIEASGRLKSDRFLRAKEYSPITRRQMKQGWRYLRRLVREGPETELDLEETVKQIGHQGFLLKPVLIPPRINRTKLILLADKDGSMRPFHKLSSHLAETARLAGRLGKADIYYFHNCPDQYIYHDPLFLEGESIDEFLKQSSSRQTVVLIFSDAGAARGGDNRERYELTRQFLDKLRQRVRYMVWLNPMPCTRWSGTTAAEIAQLVPMFEVSRQGFLGAINVLRGR